MATLMVTTATAAAAQDGSTLESSMPMNIAGPLGIIVAAVGLTGLVLGLVRFLRKSAADRVAPRAVATPVAEAAADPAVAPVLDSEPAPAATA
ncbi:hypothetical protein [Actinocrispum sp. NPDC049592]|uniref:hypothetical protein n=1 Tax=Actinocrispum sp. NPDC049592 TaxID=3154835 RepID=UPI0034210985